MELSSLGVQLCHHPLGEDCEKSSILTSGIQGVLAAPGLLWQNFGGQSLWLLGLDASLVAQRPDIPSADAVNLAELSV